MKFTGICHIVKTDVRSGEITEEKTVANTICKLAAERLLYSNLPVFDTSCKIALSTSTHPVDFERTQLDNIVAIGNSTLDGVAGYTYYEKTPTDPYQVVYHNQFPIPPATRTIGNICMIPSGTANNNLANITNDIYAYLFLQIPLVQEVNDRLDIFYKVYLDWSSAGSELPGYVQDELSQMFLSVPYKLSIGYRGNAVSTTVISSTNEDPELKSSICSIEPYGHVEAGDDSATGGLTFPVTGASNRSLLKIAYNATANFDNVAVNQHIFGITYGKITANHSNSKFFPFHYPYGFIYKGVGGAIPLDLGATLSPVYSHDDTATALFRDINTLANSSWKPSITTDGTHQGLPAIYSFNVENSGGLGIGTYSIYKTSYSGRHRSASGLALDWSQAPHPLVMTQKYPGQNADDDDVPFNERWIYPWGTSDCFWVSAANTNTTVAIWQFFPELLISQSWDLSAQGVLEINDLAVDYDNDKIYAATEQGFYEIDTALNSVTQLSSDAAKAVDVGFNDAVFAVLVNGTSDRLASSLNSSWGDACDFTGAPGDLNWNRVIFIRIDPASADYQMGIMEYQVDPKDPLVLNNYSATWHSRIHWWDNVNNYTSTIEEGFSETNFDIYLHPTFNHPYNSSFIVKDGVWVYPGQISTPNTTYVNFDTRYQAGININFIRKLVASNPNNRIFERDSDTGLYKYYAQPDRLSAMPLANLFSIRACQYGVKLNGVGIANETKFQSKFPSFTLLNTDFSGGYLAIAMGGATGHGKLGGEFGTAGHSLAVGAIEIAASGTNSAVTGFRAYNNDISHGKYWYSAHGATWLEPEFAMFGNIVKLRQGGVACFSASTLSTGLYTSVYMRGTYYSELDSAVNITFVSPMFMSTWGAPTISERTDTDWCQRYGWDSGSGTWQESDVLPGRPLHDTNEVAIDGLSIDWNDLDPGNSSDLFAGQFYTFLHFPQSTGFANDGNIGSVDFKYSYYLRPVARDVAVSDTVPAAPHQFTLPEAASDNYWLSLDPEEPQKIEIAIAGYGVNATVITSGTPSSNEILIVDAEAGILEFAADDTGKSFAGTYFYCKKLHETEVL